jgi:hypothetical protein
MPPGMKSLLLALSVLLLCHQAHADQTVWITSPGKNSILLLSWKIESVERIHNNLVIRTNSSAITFIPDPAFITDLGNLDVISVYQSAFGLLLGNEITTDAYDAAKTALLDPKITDDARRKALPIVLAYNRWFAGSSISVDDAF